jgi:hypothetical protein
MLSSKKKSRRPGFIPIIIFVESTDGYQATAAKTISASKSKNLSRVRTPSR